jgi:hypothetical protein
VTNVPHIWATLRLKFVVLVYEDGTAVAIIESWCCCPSLVLLAETLRILHCSLKIRLTVWSVVQSLLTSSHQNVFFLNLVHFRLLKPVSSTFSLQNWSFYLFLGQLLVCRIQRHQSAKMVVVHQDRLAPYLGASRDEQPQGGSSVPDLRCENGNLAFRSPLPRSLDHLVSETSVKSYVRVVWVLSYFLADVRCIERVPETVLGSI